MGYIPSEMYRFRRDLEIADRGARGRHLGQRLSFLEQLGGCALEHLGLRRPDALKGPKAATLWAQGAAADELEALSQALALANALQMREFDQWRQQFSAARVEWSVREKPAEDLALRGRILAHVRSARHPRPIRRWAGDVTSPGWMELLAIVLSIHHTAEPEALLLWMVLRWIGISGTAHIPVEEPEFQAGLRGALETLNARGATPSPGTHVLRSR